jgi:uncharacterized protein with HEPN domain
MPRAWREYAQHIIAEIDFLTYDRQGLDRAHFLTDEVRKRAYTRSLEIIGEAAKQLPETVRQQIPHIPWRAITGMHDRLIHSYFGVDYEIVWDAITTKLPTLAVALQHLLRSSVDE